MRCLWKTSTVAILNISNSGDQEETVPGGRLLQRLLLYSEVVGTSYCQRQDNELRWI